MYLKLDNFVLELDARQIMLINYLVKLVETSKELNVYFIMLFCFSNSESNTPTVYLVAVRQC